MAPGSLPKAGYPDGVSRAQPQIIAWPMLCGLRAIRFTVAWYENSRCRTTSAARRTFDPGLDSTFSKVSRAQAMGTRHEPGWVNIRNWLAVRVGARTSAQSAGSWIGCNKVLPGRLQLQTVNIFQCDGISLVEIRARQLETRKDRKNSKKKWPWRNGTRPTQERFYAKCYICETLNTFSTFVPWMKLRVITSRSDFGLRDVDGESWHN